MRSQYLKKTFEVFWKPSKNIIKKTFEKNCSIILRKSSKQRLPNLLSFKNLYFKGWDSYNPSKKLWIKGYDLHPGLNLYLNSRNQVVLLIDVCHNLPHPHSKNWFSWCSCSYLLTCEKAHFALQGPKGPYWAQLILVRHSYFKSSLFSVGWVKVKGVKIAQLFQAIALHGNSVPQVSSGCTD